MGFLKHRIVCVGILFLFIGYLSHSADAECLFNGYPTQVITLNPVAENDGEVGNVLIDLTPTDATTVTAVDPSESPFFEFSYDSEGNTLRITHTRSLDDYILEECADKPIGELCTVSEPMFVTCQVEGKREFSLSFIVEDINNKEPVFEEAPYNAEIRLPWPERVPLNQKPIEVSDADHDEENANLNFVTNLDGKVEARESGRVPGRPHTYLIDVFLRDETQQLTPDETTIVITASDGVHTANGQLNLDIKPFNVKPPKFTSTIYSVSIDQPLDADTELTPVGGVIKAEDAEGSAFIYRIGEAGDATDLVEINPADGTLKLAVNADPEYFAKLTNRVAVIEVIAEETEGEQLSSTSILVVYFTFEEATTTTPPETTKEFTCEPCPTSTTEADFTTASCPEVTCPTMTPVPCTTIDPPAECTCPSPSTAEPCSSPSTPAECNCPTPTTEESSMSCPTTPEASTPCPECECPTGSTPTEGSTQSTPFWSTSIGTTTSDGDGSTSTACPPCSTVATEETPGTTTPETECPAHCFSTTVVVTECPVTCPPETTCPTEPSTGATCPTECPTIEPCPSTETPGATLTTGCPEPEPCPTTENPGTTLTTGCPDPDPCPTTECPAATTLVDCPPSPGPCPPTEKPIACPDDDDDDCSGNAGLIAGIIVTSILFVASAGAAAFLLLKLRRVPPSPFQDKVPVSAEQLEANPNPRFSLATASDVKPRGFSSISEDPMPTTGLYESLGGSTYDNPSSSAGPSDSGVFGRKQSVPFSSSTSVEPLNTFSSPAPAPTPAEIPRPDYAVVGFKDTVEIINADEMADGYEDERL